ncbi:MAG: flavin reductase [Actinomycetospora sp.]|jgi:putative NADH-flavin reductase|nr:flavin reductase [Actinomycetospora sp.]
MRVLLLGASGRTGRWLLDELAARGHEVAVVVRSPAGSRIPADLEIHHGDVRDLAVLATALASVREGRPLDAVVSALGPRPGATTLHRDLAVRLVAMMPTAGIRRFIGISGAGVDVVGDQKSLRDRAVSALAQRFGGAVVRDKQQEYEVWSASDLDWTLVRPPRLTEDRPDPHDAGQRIGVPLGAEHRRVDDEVEHHAHRSPRRTSISRVAVARFVVDELERPRYVRAAPLVAARRPARHRRDRLTRSASSPG